MPTYTSVSQAVYHPDIDDSHKCDAGQSGYSEKHRDCDGSTQEPMNHGNTCGELDQSSGRSQCLRNSKFSVGGAKYCPQGATAIGTITGLSYDGSLPPNITCTYSAVTAPADQLTGVFDTNTINAIKSNRCGAQNFHDLTAGTYANECETYYDKSLIHEILLRIEAMSGGQSHWIGDPSAVSYINNVFRNTISIRGRALAVTPANLSQAKALVSTACAKYPKNHLCGCYNVTKYKDQCSEHSDIAGCSDWVSGNAKLTSLGASINQVAPANYFCQSSSCIDALSADSAVLPVAAQTCEQNIEACILDLSNSTLNNSTLSSSCNNVINSGGGGGGGGGGSPSPDSRLPLPFLGGILTTSTSQWIGIVMCILLVLLVIGGFLIL